MKSSAGKVIAILSIILGAVAIIATITTTLLYLEKKKDDAELERYLDDSIQ